MKASLSAEREAELERCRAELRNGWRISESAGIPASQGRKLWALVALEMRFYCADFMRGQSVAVHAKLWADTGNPHHIDAAVHLCALSGMAPPPALATEVAKVAASRLNGTVRAGTADKIVKAGVLDRALLIMLALRAAGASLSVAASKAARYIDENAPCRFKASTLERRYSERYLRGDATLEAEYLKAWQEHPPEAAEFRAAMLAGLPEAEPDLKGERR